VRVLLAIALSSLVASCSPYPFGAFPAGHPHAGECRYAADALMAAFARDRRATLARFGSGHGAGSFVVYGLLLARDTLPGTLMTSTMVAFGDPRAPATCYVVTDGIRELLSWPVGHEMMVRTQGLSDSGILDRCELLVP
jgi:hypothetical protein